MYKKAKGNSNGGRREISEDFKYNTAKLKHVKHILHNVSVALGTLTSAQHEFSRFKGRDVSPDGQLGGLGYIMSLKDIKDGLSSSIRTLSDISDTFADELTNPKWEAKEDKEVKDLLKEKEKVEEKVEEEIDPTDVVSPEPPSPLSEKELTEITEKKASDLVLSELVEGVIDEPTVDQVFSSAVIKGLKHYHQLAE
jgi:hypothetical protein